MRLYDVVRVPADGDPITIIAACPWATATASLIAAGQPPEGSTVVISETDDEPERRVRHQSNSKRVEVRAQ